VTAVPRRLIAVLTRNLLAEMLAPTYALARNVDPNEAAGRLDDALRQLRLIEGLQRGAFEGLRDAKPHLDDEGLLDVVHKKLARAKRWQPLRPKAKDDAAVAAVVLLIDAGAGVATADAWGMIESPEGHRFLEHGFRVVGAHLAKELVR
jgi:hypothetical protein